MELKFIDGVSRAFFFSWHSQWRGVVTRAVFIRGPGITVTWQIKFYQVQPRSRLQKTYNVEKKLLCYYIAFKYNQYLLPLQHCDKMKSSQRRNYKERISSWGDCTLRWLWEARPPIFRWILLQSLPHKACLDTEDRSLPRYRSRDKCGRYIHISISTNLHLI